MGKNSALHVCALAIMASFAYSQLQIVTPEILASKFLPKQGVESSQPGFVKATLGNFGHISYGQKIMGRAFYPIDNQDGCREFTGSDFTN